MAMTIHDFERKHKLLDHDVAELITKELERRELPPRSVVRTTVYHWRSGKTTPDPLLMEWLRDNAEDERVKALAGDMVEAMRGES